MACSPDAEAREDCREGENRQRICQGQQEGGGICAQEVVRLSGRAGSSYPFSRFSRFCENGSDAQIDQEDAANQANPDLLADQKRGNECQSEGGDAAIDT